MKGEPPKKNQLDEPNYKTELRHLQIQLVRFQRHLIENQLKLLIIFEGRDGAGKDSIIKRITQHASPRETRVVALGKPSDHDLRSWYFQRYVQHLPTSQEMVLMNRSWYNRAGVERVMGFCTKKEYVDFMTDVVPFEHLLINSGIQILKYYLDVSQAEQAKRLQRRRTDPLLQWKTSPIDDAALAHWDDYTAARNDMLTYTHNAISPWYVVRADNKKLARLNVIRHLLTSVRCPALSDDIARKIDKNIVTEFTTGQLLSS